MVCYAAAYHPFCSFTLAALTQIRFAETLVLLLGRGFDGHASSTTERKPMDPLIILGWVNTALSALSNGLSVAGQALALIRPFI